MFKYFISLFSLVLLGHSVAAQHLPSAEHADYLRCATSQEELIWREAHPELADEIAEAERQLHDFSHASSENGFQRTDEYVISVVFHVIHNSGPENITAEQVENAIQVMNADFSASNSSVNSVNSAFQDILADVGIRFALAQRDPEGNCTNGIVRTLNTATYAGSDGLKQISPIWDRSRYLNIWVCQTIESGAAGYSRYPSSVNGTMGAQIDGIVVRSDYVGAIGTSSIQRSHTLTHEVGHWINLPHPWGNSNDPGLSSNCDSDDGVADTPNTIGWTTCNTNGMSCGSLDNVENFMEYAFCAKMFTTGQASRMIAALNSPVAQRVNLWQPETLESTGVDLAPEICVADFSADTRVLCVGETVSFTDLSYGGIATRTWIFPGGQPASSGDANPVVAYAEPGVYAVSLLASDGNNALTDTKPNYIRVLDTARITIPFVEGFEDIAAFNQILDDPWIVLDSEPSAAWEVTNVAAFSGNQSARVRGFINVNGQTEQLLSQTFDLTELTDNAVLSFKYACAKRNSSSEDRLRVWISRDCGNTWSLRRNLDGDAIYTVDGFRSSEFIPQNQNEWTEIVISSIVPVFQTTSFQVRFEYLATNSNTIYLDDINLAGLSTLGINDREGGNTRLAVYPNPARDEVFLDLSEMAAGVKEYQIFDLSGRLVSAESWRSSDGATVKVIDVSALSAGIFFIQLTAGNERYSSKLLLTR